MSNKSIELSPVSHYTINIVLVKEKRNMTEAELEIMETLWEKGEPVFLGELLDDFNARTQKDWKKQTDRKSVV